MSTFDDDFARLNLTAGTPNIPVSKMGFEWPPPEHIYVDYEGFREALPDDNPAFVMRRVSMSQITDDQRADMTHVCRGAEYVYVDVGEWPQ